MRRPANGFTLIECLIALCLVAILLAVAVPAWSHARAAANAGAVRADLTGRLLDAVRHSTTAGSEVVICPVSATGQCRGTPNWDQGWMVFADLNGNRTADANETRIGMRAALPDGVHLRSTQGRTQIVFQPSGGNGGSNITLTLCDARGVNSATTLVLSNTGNLHAGTPSPTAAWNCVYGG